MQAIDTKALSPTDTNGARIKASCARGSITIPYPDGNQEEAHAKAAQALVDKFNETDRKQYGPASVQIGKGWNTPRVIGQLRDGRFVHVFNYSK